MKPKDQWKQRLSQRLTSEGYQLLSELQDQKSKVWVICDNNHRYSVQAQSLVKGHRCSECSNKLQSVKKHLKEREVVRRLAQFGYCLGSPYRSYMGSVTLVCPNGHNWKSDIKQFTLGRRCPQCKKK